MAHRLLRSLRRTLLSPLSSHHETLIHHRQPSLSLRTRTYITEMRKSALEGNILRLLRNEIQYELDRSPPSQPLSKFDSFIVDERPGEQWIRLNKKFGENEEIKVEVTMFDGSVPVKKTGNVATEEDVKLHITLIVDIFKGEGSDVLEFVCSAWPDNIEIQRVFMRRRDQMVGLPYNAYMGPGFKELDDELQDSLYDFLEARGINDDLAVFLHGYMNNKDKTEFIRWMGTVKTFIEKK
ncbi:hypothetical protein CsSME_00052661 [Camellia sinensis var. sinensis]|uniref:Mitochondrial glycoprotein family protein n=2 Tax=Camellia sinensis TaxID=4442 RepID=A0A7J7FT86_CAMSI|nr:uncharacterized protein At2g39795, mitochondrial-like [Camellia sinensis]KAF5931585.1 hypothetical protein HYC85_027756 [Camellia sinensis]THG07982.1 hypothetical protein TEA_020053 [Camellia sinensis var. sinensis]